VKTRQPINVDYLYSEVSTLCYLIQGIRQADFQPIPDGRFDYGTIKLDWVPEEFEDVTVKELQATELGNVFAFFWPKEKGDPWECDREKTNKLRREYDVPDYVETRKSGGDKVRQNRTVHLGYGLLTDEDPNYHLGYESHRGLGPAFLSFNPEYEPDLAHCKFAYRGETFTDLSKFAQHLKPDELKELLKRPFFL
jgi:hypothetical protein